MSGMRTNMKSGAGRETVPFWNTRVGKLLAEGIVLAALPVLATGALHANQVSISPADAKPKYALTCKDNGDGCAEMHRKAYGGGNTKGDKKEEKKPEPKQEPKKEEKKDGPSEKKEQRHDCDCFPGDDPLMFVDVNRDMRAARYSCICPEEGKEGPKHEQKNEAPAQNKEGQGKGDKQETGAEKTPYYPPSKKGCTLY